jgi:hypothetical protein
MTAIVIANVVFVALVLLVICGGLLWTIVHQPEAGSLVRLPRRGPARRTAAPVVGRLRRESA